MAGAVAWNLGLCLMLFVMLVCHRKSLESWFTAVSAGAREYPLKRVSSQTGFCHQSGSSEFCWVTETIFPHFCAIASVLCCSCHFPNLSRKANLKKNKMQALVIQIRSLWNVQPLNQQKSSKIKIHQKWGNFIPTTPELYEHHWAANCGAIALLKLLCRISAVEKKVPA